jgi:HD-GYP domain-containing protein (c-di-GMP phosphodiesterase class II)/CHASE2 domain-containing sensor protein
MLTTLKRLLIGAVIALLVLLLQHAGVFNPLNYSAMDAAFAWRPSPPQPKDVVVIGIDSASLKELGPLPWSRSRYAEAVRILRRANAKTIGFDMWFADPARNAGEDMELAQAFGLAENVYLAMHMSERDANVKVTRTTAALREKIAGEGHVNVYPDSDETLRRAVWEVHTLADRFTFLPLLLAARHMDTDQTEIREEDGDLHIGNHRAIPLQPATKEHDAFLLDLPESDMTLDYISFTDVLKERFDRNRVSGKVVLIGQVILGGGYADVWNTAKGRRFGVVVLAGIVQQIIDGRFLREAPAIVTLLLVVLLSLACPWLFRTGINAFGWISHTVLFATVWLVYLLLASAANLFLQPVPLSAAIVLSMAWGTAAKLLEARHQIIRDQRAMDILHSLGDAVITASGMPALVTGRKPDVGDSFVLPAQTPHILMKTICGAVGAREGRLFLFRNAKPLCVATVGADLRPIKEEFVTEINRRLRDRQEGFAAAGASAKLGFRAEDCPDSLLVMPLSLEDQVFGGVHLYGKHPTDASPGRTFTSSDLRLVAVMVQQATIGLENAALYENMRGIFLHVTLALANAVDAKDPYTRGHSERVILYSDRLARAAGLQMRDVQTIRLASALHDIGKIAIPDGILRKPGMLSDSEMAIMRTHPERGQAIVGPLEELGSLLPGIRHHHERFDGKGYPDGLRGEEIPLHARIICVADSFDAITSKRYYHEERSLEAGLREMERCAGTQFDPGLIRRFVECMAGVKHRLQVIPAAINAR